MVGRIYTHGMWHVKEGREDDFATAWESFAAVGKEAGARGVVLIQSIEKKNVFFSFGGWDSADQVLSFREDPRFQEQIGSMQDMLESFETFLGESRFAFGDVN